MEVSIDYRKSYMMELTRIATHYATHNSLNPKDILKILSMLEVCIVADLPTAEMVDKALYQVAMS